MVKIKALKNFGEDEKKYISDEGIDEGDEILVDDEQARALIGIGAAERAADQTVEPPPSERDDTWKHIDPDETPE